jgi:hypothetical protein
VLSSFQKWTLFDLHITVRGRFIPFDIFKRSFMFLFFLRGSFVKQGILEDKKGYKGERKNGLEGGNESELKG